MTKQNNKITLTDAFKTHRVDQDKIFTPEKTVERFMERVGKLDEDIFRDVVRVDTGRLGIPVYFATYGDYAQKLTGIKKQMGKGGTDAQARASAVMELAERFSFYAYSHEPANFITDTRKNLGERAMGLGQIARSVNDETTDVEVALDLFDRYPQRWCQATDLTRDREVLVPFDWFFAINEFNGTSAGNCTEEGLCQGLCEVVERHVSDVVSDEKIPVPAIRREGITDPTALDLLAKYDAAGIKVHLSDFSLDTGIPTVGAMAWDPKTLGKTSEVVWTAGTTAGPHKALNRALTETAQLAGDFHSGSVYVASGLPKPKTPEEVSYIIDAQKTVAITDLPDLSNDNIRLEIEACVAALAKNSMRAFSINTMHPGLRLPTFYTMVPGTGFRERSRQRSVAMFLAKRITQERTPAEALFRVGQMEKALPERYFLAFYLGKLYLDAGDYAAARQWFKKSLDRGPTPEDAPAIQLYMGLAHKEMEQYPQAVECLEAARDLDPDMPECQNLLGVCYFKLQDHARAVECFQNAVDLNPASAVDWANLAVNLQELGKTDEARVNYEKALAIDDSLDWAASKLEELKGRM